PARQDPGILGSHPRTGGQVMSSAHAFLPPSGASIWVRCALAPTMAAMFPSAADEDTRKGEAAHWVAGELHALRPVELGTVAPNGYVVNEHVLETAEAF